MKYKAVIFDLDGTLLNTLDDLADSMNSVLKSMDFPIHPQESYRYFIGDGVKTLVKRALPGPQWEFDRYNEDTHDTQISIEGDDSGFIGGIVKQMQAEYRKRLTHKTRPYEEISELLDCLAEKSVRMSILTNKPQALAQSLVDHYFNRWKFDCILGSEDSRPRKPDPTGCQIILKTTHTEPEECVFVGDTRTDMETAQAARLYAVGVLWGFRDREELIAYGADSLISHPSELLSVIG